MVIPIPPAAMKMLLSSFGKEALGNPKTAESMAKGFESLGKAVTGGLKENIKEMKELFDGIDTKAPALSLLSAQFQSETMTAQTELMIALMELAKSEGVQLGVSAIAGIVSSVVNAGKNMADFAKEISDLIGKTAQSSPYWTRIETAFSQLQGQTAKTLTQALSTLLSTIKVLVDNPISAKTFQAVFSGIELSLKKTTIALNVLDMILQKIEERLAKLFPILFPESQPTTAPEGYTIVGLDTAEEQQSTGEQIMQTFLDMITGGGTLWVDILNEIVNQVNNRNQQVYREQDPLNPNRGYQS